MTARACSGRHRAPLLALAVASCLLVALAQSRAQTAGDQAPADEPPRTALVIEVEGAIGPATTQYLRQAFDTAAERDAALIVLRLDTPGGLASAMRDIIRDLLASRVPVVTYVAPGGARAASAGTYILYASHLAAMAPGTNLGAATPVQMGGGGPLPGDGGEEPEEEGTDGEDGEDGEAPADASEAKAVNDAVAYIRGLAELQGRNADWAERAVREAASLPAREALERNVVEIVARDLEDLLAQADGRRIRLAGEETTLRTAGLEVTIVEPDWRARLLAVITDPNIAFILMTIGIYGIIFELASPGAVFPGVTGGIALVVGLYALNLLPLDYAGLGLVLLGIALMTAEAFAPSFGILGIGGAVAFALGSLFMFEEAPGFELSPWVVLTATAASALLLAVALAAVVRAYRNRLASGEPATLGETGKVLSWSGTGGQVLVHGERWNARSGAPLEPGARVRVRGREELVLVVEPETPPEA